MTSPRSRLRTVASKRKVIPFLQGELDGLCGLYAIVNAVRALCPEVDDEVSDRLFLRMLHYSSGHSNQSLLMVADGINATQLLELVHDVTAYLLRRRAINLRIETCRLSLERRTLPAVFEALSRELDRCSVMLLPLSGYFNHWTLLYRVDHDTLHLLDSTAHATIKRSRCTLKRSKTRYRLHTANLLKLVRES